MKTHYARFQHTLATVSPILIQEEFMKIILLSGKSNTGKTTTLNIVHKDLINQGGVAIQNKLQLGKNPKDFKTILEYHEKNVAIFSMGDYYWQCRRAINDYAKCDYLILAYSDKFKWNLKDAIARDPKNSVIVKTSNNAEDANAVISAIK
jgi:hypothetical protein